MSGLITAVAVSAGAGMISANQQRQSAKGAANAQIAAGDRAVEEQKRQFDKLQELLAPYVGAGDKALGGLMDVIGLNGPEKASQAIIDIEGSPEFQALTRTGEEAILQNASATGGLRGGNVQEALAKFRPETLSSLINQRIGRLGAVANMGQNSAAFTGNAGMQTAANVGNIYQNQGEAIAQGALARGNANAQTIGSIGKGFGMLLTGGF